MSKLRILIVEDEAVTAADLYDELVAQGYEVIGTADTAAAALRLAETSRPDIVLMDINLAGEGDGIHAASAIRSAEIPVIFLTAHYDERTLGRAKLASPVGYITKPFEQHQLVVAIEMGIQRHRSDLERMRLLRELDQERNQVKLLSSLLPICSGCKKIRSGDGLWQSVEHYITRHSDVSFTQGWCSDCAPQHREVVPKHVAD